MGGCGAARHEDQERALGNVMIFSSFSFIVFLLATLSLYGLARSQRERAGFLLAASLIFYASWKPAYLLLLLASLALNYRLYQRVAATRSRAWLVGAVALNLVFLGLAKYMAFFTGWQRRRRRRNGCTGPCRWASASTPSTCSARCSTPTAASGRGR
jgi:hypothetical protein